MNRRLTVAAAVAVVLASTSVATLISGTTWLFAVIGAVAATALSGSLARLAPLPAAAGGAALALLACLPLLSVRHWFAAVIAVAVAAGFAARAARPRILHGFAIVVTPLAALLLYLNAVYAGRESLARLLPTARSVHFLSVLAGQGWDLRKFAPPVPGSPGVQLLAAASIGLVAIAIDLVAVRFRRPALAGVGLLVLYLAPVTTSASMGGATGVITFCLAGTGYLAMLSADGRYRLRAFGHVVSVWSASSQADRIGGPDTKALAASGRRIGLAAVCLAVLAPLVLPSLQGRHPPRGSGIGAVISGAGAAQLPDPLVTLQTFLSLPHPRTVLTYTTNATDPADQYLQIYVLNYDAASMKWTLARLGAGLVVGSQPLPRPPGLLAGSPASTVRTSVTIGNVAAGAGTVAFLPVPYAVTGLSAPGSWQQDQSTRMIYSAQPSIAGLRYQAVSTEPDPSPALLRGPQRPSEAGSQYLGFRSPVSKQLRAIALSITRGKQTAYAKAAALQDWFLAPNRFSYSLQSNLPNSPRALLEFLDVTRSGDCQQFAFAMAALARLLGIPARIAVGFTAGSLLHGSTWRVTTADAHAWPELYFRGFGWLRFEPTPGGTRGQGTAVKPSYASSGPLTRTGGPLLGTGSLAGGKGATHPGTAANVHRFSTPDTGGGSRITHRAAGGHRGRLPVAEIAAVLLLLAAAAPGIARLLVRWRRWRAAAGDAGLANAAWLELRDDLTDVGIACRASESPRAVARRVTAQSGLPEAARLALDRIASVVEQARYAPAPAPAGPLRADLAIVRRGLARSVSRRNRCRAILLPPSILRAARLAAQRRLAASGGLDPAGQVPGPSLG